MAKASDSNSSRATVKSDPETRRKARPLIAAILSAGPQFHEHLRQLKAQSWPVATEVLNRILSVPRLNREILGKPFPVSLGELGQSPISPQAGTLTEELRWLALILHRHSTTINTFLAIKESLESSLVRADYSAARELLEDASRRFGFSLWGIECTLLLEELEKGLQGNRAYAQSVHAATSNPLVTILSQLLSRRTDSRAPARDFAEVFRTYFSDYDHNIPFVRRILTFFRLHLARHLLSPEDMPLLPSVVAEYSRYSLIDRYLGLVRVMEAVSSLFPFHDVGPLLNEPLKKLHGLIADARLARMSELFLFEAAYPVGGSLFKHDILMTAIDEYTRGEYDLAKQTTLTSRVADPLTFEFYELHARAVAHSDNAPTRQHRPTTQIDSQLVYHLVQVILRSSDWTDSLQQLRKLAQLLDSTRLGGSLLAFCLQYEGSSTSMAPHMVSALNAAVLTPRALVALPLSNVAQTILSQLEIVYPGNSSIQLFKALYEATSTGRVLPLPASVPVSRTLRYRARVLQQTVQLLAAATVYKEAFARPDLIDDERTEVVAGVFDCLMSIGHTSELATFIVEACLKDESLVTARHVQLLATACDPSAPLSTPVSIDLPILHYLNYRLNARGGDPTKIYQALDAFLSSCGVRIPSDLTHQTTLDRSKLVFLLRYVCIPTFLDGSIAYASSDDLETQRILVCQALEQLDNSNAAAYREEGAQLTKNAAIRRAIQNVDTSRIEVDTEGIRQSLPDQFFELFSHYSAIQALAAELRTLVRVHMGKGEPQFRIVDDSLELLRSLFGEITRRFISSNEHGLDSNLSVRVRHGTLLGQLRAPFEHSHLITRKPSADGPYADNDHWVPLLAPNPSIAVKANAVFAGFSAKVDDIIAVVRDQWIQIRSESTPNALFDYQYSDMELRELRTSLKEVVDPQAFVTVVFDELWRRTRRNLEGVRKAIRDVLSSRLMDALQDLERDLRALIPHALKDTPAFRNAVTQCRTDIQDELAIVAGWFDTADNSAPDFDMSLLIDAGVATLRRIPGVQLDTQIDVRTSTRFQGATFRAFIDLIYIILDNIIKHCGLPRPRATISVSESRGRLIISVDNPLAPAIDWRALRLQVPELERHANRTHDVTIIRREGGSGFYKLGKILRHNLRRVKASVILSVTENEFAIRVQMETQGIRL